MTYKVGLSAINVPDEARQYMGEVMALGNIGQASEFLPRFEKLLADYADVKHCIVTSSGTMADAIAIGAMKQKYNPRRVIMPALTFIAQPNSVYYNGLDTEFVDIDDDYLMDWKAARNHFDWQTSLYFPSDCMGRVSMQGQQLRVVEDACEAFGSKMCNHSAGTFGELGTFSFFVSHTITTGEGGAIITNDDWLASLCRSLRSHGRRSDTEAMDKFSFPHLGFNGKISAPQAAIGCGVMAHAKEYVEQRHANYVIIRNYLGGFRERLEEYLVPHGYPIEFRSEMDRDDAMRHLLKDGIECRKFFSCIPTMEGAYHHLRLGLGNFPHAEHVAATHLYVPCHQNMTAEDVRFVCERVLDQKGRIKKESLGE